MKHYTVMNVSELLLYPTAQINHTGIEWSERRQTPQALGRWGLAQSGNGWVGMSIGEKEDICTILDNKKKRRQTQKNIYYVMPFI